MFDIKLIVVALASLGIGAGASTAYHNSTVINYAAPTCPEKPNEANDGNTLELLGGNPRPFDPNEPNYDPLSDFSRNSNQ